MIKSVKDFDREENCACGSKAKYEFVPNANAIAKQSGMQDTAEYNPGLGCVVRNKSHKKEICKIKGVEEIGNESPEKIHKHFDKRREEKIESAYEEADRGWVGSGDVT